jgi:hypothetical protein
MLRTVEAIIDERGRVQLTERIELRRPTKALVTILEDANGDSPDAAILAESALAEGWSGAAADEAWKHLEELPSLDEAKQ